MNKLVSTLKSNAVPYVLNSNWTWYKWGDLIETYQQGLIRSNSQLNDHSGIDYFKMSFINEDGTYTFNNLPKTFATDEEIDKYKLSSGDFLINVRNSMELVGKSCVVYHIDREILFNHMLVRIKHKEYITGSYVNAFLNTSFGRRLLNTCKKGTTTVIALYQKDIYEIPIPIPNKYLLQKIDKIYNNINKKIELNNQINAELEAMAKMLYDYWFVQFDFPFDFAQGKPAVVSTSSTTGDSDAEPVEATGIAASASVNRGYKSSGGKMVYNEVLKRKIPEGWEVTVFNDWISKTKTGDWGKEDIEGNYTEHVYCVRGADINGLNGKGEVKAPERFILKNNLVKSLKPNDFVVEISGGSPTQSTGRIALLTQASLQRFDSNVICSNFCKALSLKDNHYVFNFLQEWQRLYDAGVFFGYEGKTSGIKNFLFDSFMTSYDIVKPPKHLVEIFYKHVETLEKKKQINLQQNEELAQLRDWLLPMLMNGQVTVGEVEEKMGMVAEEKMAYSNNLNI